MKMNIFKSTTTLLSIIIFSIMVMPAYAHQNSTRSNSFDRLDQRMDNQHYRIRKGIDDGELTRKEVKRLSKQQHYIMRLKHMFMRDGYLDRYEISELKDVLDRASKRIKRLKHNNHNRHARYYY